MNWPVYTVEQVTERFISGGTPSTKCAEYWQGDIPWITGADFSGQDLSLGRKYVSPEAISESATNIVPQGALLLVSRTGVGKIAVAPVDIAISQDITGIIPNPGIDVRYLKMALKNKMWELKAAARGAIIKGFTRKDLKRLSIALPSLSEQQRIVEILDQADRLRQLRHEADQKAQRILPALFIKMFGDTATNPNNWPTRTLRSVIDNVAAGWSAPSLNRPKQAGETGVLKVSAVTTGRFNPTENKAVDDIPAGRSLLQPQRGDLLFSRANTRELVAATCMVEDDYPDLFLPDKLWRITPKPDEATTRYLRQLLATKAIRDQLRARATGSSGSMLNISQAAMLSTPIPIPPYDLQCRFSDLAEKTNRTLSDMQPARENLETLNTTLLHRAFTGDLTAEWRKAHMTELLAEMEQQAKLLNLPNPIPGQEKKPS